METMTITNWNGTEKKLTKEEYVEQWTWQVKDLWAIAITPEDMNQGKLIKEQIREMAERFFEANKD